jgi:hypothetical protein
MLQKDREALTRALRIAKASEPGRQEQLVSMLRDREWEEVATFAAYVCQCDSLHLRPWQLPPMHADEDRPRDDHPTAGKVAAWTLRRRLLKAGLSVFEPDPISSLESVAARQRVRAGQLAPNGVRPATRPPACDSHDESAPLEVLAASERARSVDT